MANWSEPERFHFPAKVWERKPQDVWAVQYDGENATAYSILAWMERNGDRGTFDGRVLRIGDLKKEVEKNSYVVLKHNHGFEVWKPHEFVGLYSLKETNG